MYSFPNTRWSLIAALPQQPQQVGPLMLLYADAIGAYLQTRLTGERAERVDDIVQEVLVDLLTKPELLAKAQPGEGGKFRYYLMHVAWLAACNALRHHRRREPAMRSPSGDGVELITDRPGNLAAPDQAAMDRAWAVGIIQGALDDLRLLAEGGSLPTEAVQILTRTLVEGQPLRDIAADLGLSLATCHRRSAQARTALQEAIAERLRLAGELGPGEDPTAACEVLLSAIAQG